MASVNNSGKVPISSAKRRIRKQATATVAAVTVAVLCNVGSTEGFSLSPVSRRALHLNDASPSSQPVRAVIGNRLSSNDGGRSPRSSSLHAVTDPEVLLKDLFDQSSKARSASASTSSSSKKVKRTKKKNASTGTMINMNMDDLYRWESSFDSSELGELPKREDVRKRSNIKVKDMKQSTISSSRSKSKRSRRATSVTQVKKSPEKVPSKPITPPRVRISAKTTASSKATPRTSTKNKANGNISTGTRGRSSTMPGFLNSKSTQRHQAFRDGLNIAKKSNSRQVATKIHKALNSEKEVLKRRKTSSEAMYSGSASVPDSLIAFTNELHKESRITPKEEVELGTKTQDAIHVQNIHDNLEKKLGRKPTDNEWCAAAGKINIEALNEVLEEGLEAKHRLVTSNLRMVQGVVNLYIRNGLGSQYNAGDLMQEGTTALIRAAEKFEPKRGFRFSTYAMYWIRAAVKRSQILQSRIINIPQRLHETHKKITKVESELKKELGRKPNKSELAIAVGITEVQLERCLKAMSQNCLSLDAELENSLNPNKSSNKDTMYNILAAQYDNVEQKQVQTSFLKDDLVSTLRRYLSPHEVDLLLLRYGLMDERTMPYGFSGPLTIAEVSRLVGLKPDKVRRMINKCLRQLRHLIAHEWEDFEKELP